jgi:hypothetical protein
MTYYQLRARDCLRLGLIFLIIAAAAGATAILTGPSWLSLTLAVLSVQGLNLAASEFADRRRYLNRSRR